MYRLLASSFLTLFWALTAVADRRCQSAQKRGYAEKLAALKPSTDLALPEFEVFSGGKIGIGYEYEVGPAYTNGLYSRSDRWFIKTSLADDRNKNFSEDETGHLKGGIDHRLTATFTRFFKNPCEALLATPYSLKRAPVKAKIALGAGFLKGDYFLLRNSLGFVVSADILSLLSSGVWGLGVSGSYLLEGLYQIHIVRLSDYRVRLKIVARRGRHLTGSLSLGYQKKFEVFKLGIINRQVEKIINTTPLKLQGDKGGGQVFMVDYILDLSDAEVASAFDNVLLSAKKYRRINDIKPFKDLKNLQTHPLLDLTALENIFHSDIQNNRQDRIVRNLRTSSGQSSQAIQGSLGNRIFGATLDRKGSSARMSLFRKDESKENYLLKSWEKDWESRFFYSWSKSFKTSGFRALFSANQQFEDLRPVNMISFIQHKKNRFTFRDFINLKKTLKKILSLGVFNKIPFSEWKQSKNQKFNNYGLRFEMILAPEGILEAPSLSADEVRVFFLDYLKSKDLVPEDFFPSNFSEVPAQNHLEVFNFELYRFSKLFSQVLDRGTSVSQKVELLARLRKNKLFIESGIGFLMFLRPMSQENNFHLDLNISSNEAIINFSFGKAQLSELYKKILTIKSALDDDAFDLLREAESISNTGSLKAPLSIENGQ
jgi:hypothetical protein